MTEEEPSIQPHSHSWNCILEEAFLSSTTLECECIGLADLLSLFSIIGAWGLAKYSCQKLAMTFVTVDVHNLYEYYKSDRI